MKGQWGWGEAEEIKKLKEAELIESNKGFYEETSKRKGETLLIPEFPPQITKFLEVSLTESKDTTGRSGI